VADDGLKESKKHVLRQKTNTKTVLAAMQRGSTDNNPEMHLPDSAKNKVKSKGMRLGGKLSWLRGVQVSGNALKTS